MQLVPGTLWRQIRKTTDKALHAGALVPITTKSSRMQDDGVVFSVRMISSLKDKAAWKGAVPGQSDYAEKTHDPFFCYETDLFVASLSDTHMCLLNKYNVIDHHILVVTREFEDQETLLTRGDFAAILQCIVEFNGLAFYNGGKTAGASQPHKHLQMIPLPMCDEGPMTPMDPLFADTKLAGGVREIPELPFVHAFADLAPFFSKGFLRCSNEVYGLYRDMMQAVGLNAVNSSEHTRQAGPYNLLFTRQWMLLVPRSHEFFGSMSVNALGYAGALLVRDEREMGMVKQNGGMAILKHTAMEKP